MLNDLCYRIIAVLNPVRAQGNYFISTLLLNDKYIPLYKHNIYSTYKSMYRYLHLTILKEEPFHINSYNPMTLFENGHTSVLRFLAEIVTAFPLRSLSCRGDPQLEDGHLTRDTHTRKIHHLALLLNSQ